MRCLLALALVLVSASAGLAGQVSLTLDGVPLSSKPPAEIRGGHLFVPASVFRKIGLWVDIQSPEEAEVAWPASDAIWDFRAGRKWVSGQEMGTKISISAAPFVRSGVLMVPLKEVFGHVTWDAKSRTAHLHRSEDWLRWLLDEEQPWLANPDKYEIPLMAKSIFLPMHTLAEAKRLEAAGDWQGAEKLLRQIMEFEPYAWEEGRSHSSTEWAEYGVLGKILVREHPESSEGYFYSGIGEAVAKRYTEAQAQFAKAAEIDPRNADYQWAIGWAVLRAENVPSVIQRNPDTISRALGYFEKALTIDPNHRRALVSAAYSYRGLAFLINAKAGYTDQSRAEVKPYLDKATQYFERLADLRENVGKG